MDTTPPFGKPYPSDVDDEEWDFVVPYLTLMDEAAPQRRYPLRELFNGLRWIVRARHPRNGKIVERADDSGGDAQASWHAGRRISSYRSIEVGVSL